ncbi:MAG TPA: efflux RND transporter periplasmic adaptor subunit [Verrucomicrobiae bacterium]|nr:efflux RND transporter periplasmic adaptor subunit [Verrucomicrobiae bacterium]
MKPKQLIVTLLVVLGAGVGVYFLIQSRGAASGSDEESAGENVPTVVSVQVGALRRMTLHRYLTAYGTVAPAPATADAPAADAPLAAPSAGIVNRINVFEGERVRRGQVLMTLNSSAMTEAYAEAEVERQKKLYAEHNTSLKNLQAAETQLALLRVVSPLDGTVVSLNVKPGAAVDASTMVAEVMDLHRLTVKTEVPESQAHQLQPGQPVQVLTQPPVEAPLSFISPTVDTNNSTVRVWAALPPDSGLRPGQFVPLRIVTAVHTNCLAAPEASVVTDVAGRSVISLVQGDEAIQTPVQIGFRENGWVEVEGQGLQAGDTVVTVGAYGLPEKTQIKIVNPGGEQ